MIKLEKGQEPAILARKSNQWTRTVVQKIQAGQEPTKTEKSRYNHPEIKAELLKETHSKCAYCESKFRHVTYGDIEHVVPKSQEPSMRWSWLVGQSEGFFKVYFDWLIVPSSNGIVLPNRADVNVVVRVRPGW